MEEMSDVFYKYTVDLINPYHISGGSTNMGGGSGEIPEPLWKKLHFNYMI